MYVKSSSQRDAKKMFDGEYASLEAMEKTGKMKKCFKYPICILHKYLSLFLYQGCIRVPHPIRALDNPRGGGALLVEEFLDLNGGLSGEPARKLGRSFARCVLVDWRRRFLGQYGNLN